MCVYEVAVCNLHVCVCVGFVNFVCVYVWVFYEYVFFCNELVSVCVRFVIFFVCICVFGNGWLGFLWVFNVWL